MTEYSFQLGEDYILRKALEDHANMHTAVFDQNLSLPSAFLDQIRSGKKSTTIKYKAGTIRMPRSELPAVEKESGARIGKAVYDGVNIKPFGALTEEDARLDGFATLDELRTEMRRSYGEIKSDEPVVIHHISGLREYPLGARVGSIVNFGGSNSRVVGRFDEKYHIYEGADEGVVAHPFVITFGDGSVELGSEYRKGKRHDWYSRMTKNENLRGIKLTRENIERFKRRLNGIEMALIRRKQEDAEGLSDYYDGYVFGTKMGIGVFIGINHALEYFDVWLTKDVDLSGARVVGP